MVDYDDMQENIARMYAKEIEKTIEPSILAKMIGAERTASGRTRRMKEFILGISAKVVIIVLAIGATGMAMLALGVVTYAFDIDIFMLLALIAVIAILWQICEAIKRGRERKRLDERLKELRDRAERRKAARGNE
jgi:hypothetical protein